MSLAAKLRRAPLRISTGAYILNSGLAKLSNVDDDAAKRIHGMASGAYPQFERIDPKVFVKLVGVGETALGAALLLPMVPAGVAGIGLLGFSSGLMTMYWRTPGLHEEGSLRPTPQGIAMAKDSWMVGAGATLVIDAVLQGAHDKRKSAAEGISAAAAAGAVSAGASIRSWFSRARVAAAGTTSYAVEAAKQATVEHGPDVVAALTSVGAVVVDKASQAAATAREAAKSAADERGPAIGSALSTAGAAVADRVAQVAEAARDARDEYAPQAGAALGTARDTLADRAAQVAEAARDARDEYAPQAGAALTTARDTLADRAAQTREVAADRAAQAREVAADKAEQLRDVAADKAEQLRDVAADATDQARGTATDSARRARQTATDRANRLRLHG